MIRVTGIPNYNNLLLRRNNFVEQPKQNYYSEVLTMLSFIGVAFK